MTRDAVCTGRSRIHCASLRHFAKNACFHDTDTLRGHLPDREPWELIELALSSRPALCMIPVQDVLGLGSEGRMNTPGEPFGNWSWQLEHGQLTDALAERLRAATAATRRLP